MTLLIVRIKPHNLQAEVGVRRSSQLTHAETLPLQPLVGDQAESAVPRSSGTRKGKGEMKVQGGHGDDDVNGPSYRVNHDLSARYLVQQASLHSMLPKKC